VTEVSVGTPGKRLAVPLAVLVLAMVALALGPVQRADAAACDLTYSQSGAGAPAAVTGWDTPCAATLTGTSGGSQASVRVVTLPRMPVRPAVTG